MFRKNLKETKPRTQQYSVDLSADERAELNAMLSAGTYKTRDLTRPRCLLHSDDGLTDPEVSEAVGCHPGTVGRIQKRYTEDGLAAILADETDPKAIKRLTAAREYLGSLTIRYRRQVRLASPDRLQLVGSH